MDFPLIGLRIPRERQENNLSFLWDFFKGSYMRITLRQLSVFLAVFETHQISKAARMMPMSVSAASQCIKDLETALGSVLFERLASGLFPTDAAQTLLPYANLIVNKAGEVESVFAKVQSGVQGRLTIGANRNYGIYVMPRKLQAFHRRFPAVETSLIVEDSTSIEEGVLSNRFDIGFIEHRPQDPSLTSFACLNDRYCIVAGVSNDLARNNVTVEELSRTTWILTSEAQERESALNWLVAQGISVPRQIIMNMMGSIKRAVGTGQGLTVLPYLAVREEILRGDLVEIQPFGSVAKKDSDRRIYVVFKEDHAEALRKALLQYCEITPID